MSQRSKAIEVLSDYFDEKGEILSPKEYKKETDAPIRLEIVKRTFGTWSRMEKIVRAFDARNKNRPEPSTDADKIIAEQNKKLADHEALIRAIGEDVEQKTAREEAARAQIEADALNAATPEGARENKVRKGGPESIDAKTIKESLQRAVANEHAMLAKTPEGAALGKQLLGGVEDQDAKNLAIARENARTERSAMLATTGEGSALAKMEEDDSDGHLTREAQARVRNELRPYVEPATDDAIDAVEAEAREKMRPEAHDVIDELLDTDTLSIGAANRGDLAFENSAVEKIVTEGDRDLAPPADRLPDADMIKAREDDTKKNSGLVFETDPDKSDTTEGTLSVTTPKTTISAPAKENKDSVNLEQNKANPEAPPATRNPDPAVANPPAEEKTTPKK